MRHTLSAVLLLLTVRSIETIAGATQSSAGAPNPAADNSLIVSLLEQSHDIDQQLSLAAHLDLLSRQVSILSRVEGGESKQLAEQWAGELFALAAHAKQPSRSYLQGSALTTLVRLNPNRALELLQTAQLDTEVAPSPKMQLALQVFITLEAAGGIGVLPLLQEQADQLGAQGQYPYGGLAVAAMQAVNNDWRDNAPHARDVLRSVFEPAFARYNQTPPNYANDYEFGRMLQQMAGGLPFETIQPALRTFVNHLLATDPANNHYMARVSSRDGDNFHTDNAIDAAIMWFGRLVIRDPELVQQLETSRPDVKPVLECYKSNRCNGGAFGHTSPNPPPRVQDDPDAQTRQAAIFLAHTNPDLAIAKTETIGDVEKRAAAAFDVARGMAGSHPEQAEQLINQAQNAVPADDSRKQINLISAQVSLAAAQNQQEQLRQLLERAFELAAPLVAQPIPPDMPPFIPGLPPMVQIGAQNYPGLTVGFLQNLPPGRMKAELLIAAASALQMPNRLRTRSHATTAYPPPKPRGL